MDPQLKLEKRRQRVLEEVLFETSDPEASICRVDRRFQMSRAIQSLNRTLCILPIQAGKRTILWEE